MSKNKRETTNIYREREREDKLQICINILSHIQMLDRERKHLLVVSEFFFFVQIKRTILSLERERDRERCKSEEIF